MSEEELSKKVKEALESQSAQMRADSDKSKFWKTAAIIAYRIGLVIAILQGGKYAWNATIKIDEIAKLPEQIAKDRAMYATHDEVLQLKADSNAVIANHEMNLKKVDTKVTDGVLRVVAVEDAVNKLDGKVSVLIETLKNKS